MSEDRHYFIPDFYKNGIAYQLDLDGFKNDMKWTFENCHAIRNAVRLEKLLIDVIEHETTIEKSEAIGDYFRYKVVEVPNDVAWHIAENSDGTEYVSENHRTWG